MKMWRVLIDVMQGGNLIKDAEICVWHDTEKGAELLGLNEFYELSGPKLTKFYETECQVYVSAHLVKQN